MQFDTSALGSPPWPFDDAARSVRRLHDMPGYFPADAAAVGDPVIYEVFQWPSHGLPTDLMVTVTVLHPGHVGGAPFHTKGHFHRDPDGEELVAGIAGSGVLELFSRAGEHRAVRLSAGTHVSVAPGWAHRVVNPGSEPVLYLSVSSAFIGHDYEGVREAGWVGPYDGRVASGA